MSVVMIFGGIAAIVITFTNSTAKSLLESGDVMMYFGVIGSVIQAIGGLLGLFGSNNPKKADSIVTVAMLFLVISVGVYLYPIITVRAPIDILETLTDLVVPIVFLITAMINKSKMK